MVDDSQDPKRPSRISHLARSLAGYCGEKQREHAQIAQDFGYSKEVFEIVALNYSGLPDDPIYAATEASLTKFDAFVRARELKVEKYRYDVSSASYAIATTTSSAAAPASIAFSMHEPGAFIKNHKIPDPPPHRSPNRTQSYADRLAQLDPELGKLMRSAWQSFYGGAEKAERAALLSMRQLYDQFFGLLAPDAVVRNTPFFHSKSGDNPQQVHRMERLNYVAASRVKDPSLAEVLQAEADQMLKLSESDWGYKHSSRTGGVCNSPQPAIIPAELATGFGQWPEYFWCSGQYKGLIIFGPDKLGARHCSRRVCLRCLSGAVPRHVSICFGSKNTSHFTIVRLRRLSNGCNWRSPRQ